MSPKAFAVLTYLVEHAGRLVTHDELLDWVGAISAGATAASVFFLIKSTFPRLTGVRFYALAGLLIGVLSLLFRELLRCLGI